MRPDAERPALTEGWILAGTLDGRAASPALTQQLGGLSQVQRLALDLTHAGVKRVVVVWCGEGAAPDLSAVAAEPRLAARATLEVVTAAPTGAPGDGILVVRADRVYHRDVPKLAASAWRAGTSGESGQLGMVAGAEYDVAMATDRATAAALCAVAATEGGLASAVASARSAGRVLDIEPPYVGFCTAAPDRKAISRAERRLVWSLRKSADGIAAKLVNRHISLPLSWLLSGTKIHPNHITIIAFLCAVAGGITIAQGSYLAGLVGMLLVELGSIVDGIDGELARLRYQFSRTGQWLDTVADDLGNVSYTTGVMISLDRAGVTWAIPVGTAALCAFAVTQGTQYFLIVKVYKSGDLAAIPWAFQSSEFLSQRPSGLIPWIKATVPKMLKRDFVVTAFLVFAALGQLLPILVVFCAGAFVFFVVLMTQMIRNWGEIMAAAQRARVA